MVVRKVFGCPANDFVLLDDLEGLPPPSLLSRHEREREREREGKGEGEVDSLAMELCVCVSFVRVCVWSFLSFWVLCSIDQPRKDEGNHTHEKRERETKGKKNYVNVI